MIFVTVGTHEQQFNRLIKHMDEWAACHDEKLVIQTGYSTYKPQFCQWKKLYSYKEMIDLVEAARIVITHGGPASFIMPLQIGKVPIVVPRQLQFGEHVNNHQLDFCTTVEKRYHNILLVKNIDELFRIIDRYDEVCADLKINSFKGNHEFNQSLEKIVQNLWD